MTLYSPYGPMFQAHFYNTPPGGAADTTLYTRHGYTGESELAAHPPALTSHTKLTFGREKWAGLV